MNWLSVLVGVIFGLIAKVLYDRFKAPRLKIIGINPVPFALDTCGGKYHAYRVRVLNEQKVSEAADGCVIWLRLDSAFEDYQLSWVGSSDPSVTAINVGDSREFDLCAIHAGNGVIIAPTERGYFCPDKRDIGSAAGVLRGTIRITCRNGKRAEKHVEIKPCQDAKGEYFLEVILTKVVSETNDRWPFGLVTAGAILFTLFATLLGYEEPNMSIKVLMWMSFGLSILFLLTVLVKFIMGIMSNMKVATKHWWISINRYMGKWINWLMTSTAQAVLQLYFLGFVITWLISLNGKSGCVVSMTIYVGFIWLIVLISNGFYNVFKGKRID